MLPCATEASQVGCCSVLGVVVFDLIPLYCRKCSLRTHLFWKLYSFHGNASSWLGRREGGKDASSEPHSPLFASAL